MTIEVTPGDSDTDDVVETDGLEDDAPGTVLLVDTALSVGETLLTVLDVDNALLLEGDVVPPLVVVLEDEMPVETDELVDVGL